ncbi:MAG: ATP-binding protein [Hyphomicrobiaceae bacterium]
MRFSKFKTIEGKVAGMLLASVLVATVLAAGASAWRETERRFETRREMLMGLATTLAATLAGAVEKADQRGVTAQLNGVASLSKIRYAVVVDAAGQRLYEVGNGIVLGNRGDRLAANREIGAFTSIKLRTYLVSAPVISGGRMVGQLSLIADVSDLRDALQASLLEAMLAGVVAAALAMAAAARLQGSITKPIVALTAATESIRTSRDYSQSVARTSDDEAGRLVEAFNTMMLEIRDRDAALCRQRDGLADTVAERTRDLVLAKDVAERANAAKSEFLATMSHEIRTPMNGMMVMAELMAAGNLAPKARRHCDIILKSGQVLLSLINDVLDLSKIEAGHLTLEQIACDPAETVEDVLQLFSERALSSGLELAWYCAPDVPNSIVSDPLRLRQILSNLVNNALKFTEKGGVLVRLEHRIGADGRPRLQFQVRDTGIGIPPDALQRLFDPFTQADASTTRRFGGTGIGLTICRKLARAMGGDITVQSTVARGSTFTLDVPVTVDVPASPHAPRSGAVAIALADGPVREAIACLIGDLGLQIAEPADAGAARLIIADAVFVAALEPGDLEQLPPLLAITSLGDTAVTSLIDEGFACGLIEAPVGGQRTRDVIVAALDGRVREYQAAMTAAVVDAREQPFAGYRVLAADDSPVNREVLAETLHRLGVQVTNVETGAAALSAVASGNFDLIFMDGSMPEMDGQEATRRILALLDEAKRAPIPIVALSANILGADAENWRRAGACDFVSKPFSLSRINDCLARWLSATTVAEDHPPLAAAASEGHSASTTLLDPGVLDSIRQIQAPGDDLPARIAGLYIEHAPRLLADLAALHDAEPVRIARAAHALKSLSRNIGALRVGDLCDVIETNALENRPPSPAQLTEVARVAEATMVALTGQFQIAA